MRRIYSLLAVLLLLTGCTRTEPTKNHSANQTVATDDGAAVEMVSFDIYAINDLHGRLIDTNEQPGVDELSTYLKQQKDNTILLSTGDMWQGTSESAMTRGLIITEWMNRMDFAAMTVGGHEFDWGEEWVRENSQLAEFPILGINVYSRQTDRRVDYCQSSVVVDIEGAQIGIIGAIGDCYNSISSENIKDIYFKTGTELTELVKQEAERLRSEGADFIIYTIHDGYDQTTTDTKAISAQAGDIESYYDTTLSNGYVDLVFEADSHYWYMLRDEHGVYHLQAGGNNQGLSHARVALNKNDGTFLLIPELIPNNAYEFMEDDPMVAELLEAYAEQIAPATRVLGNNPSYKNSAALCQLVADLYCSKGVEKWGKEYDIVLGGGYISCRSPGYLTAGQVTYSQLQALLPFDNQIMLCSIRGSDLVSRFLENDHYAYYIKTTAYGESIQRSIDPDATYYLVTDSYSALYSYNNMTVIDTYDGSTFARDLLAEYIANGS